ncbi:DUF1028 domain-containing protein [Halobacterium noricense]|uniref:DUF1028 domain-containing protein n=1 Tax=Halobacterium noricense TaxID=223182 RepID=UPI0022B7CD75|nr:DUF1028 domain-containing protein [Halobacterium noricense]
MTFSIVAHDPETDAVGVAVQSKFVGVGAAIPFASADAGAVATRRFANGDGEDQLVNAIWHGLSRLDRK